MTFAERVKARRIELGLSQAKLGKLAGNVPQSTIGQIENGKCKVSIVAVGKDDPLYKVKNDENALAFYTRYYQPIPLLLRGYGAGNAVTAAGIFADILRTLKH